MQNQVRTYKEIHQEFEKFRLDNESHLWRLHLYHLDNDVKALELYALLLQVKLLLSEKPNEHSPETASLKMMQIYLATWLSLRGAVKEQPDRKLPVYLNEMIANLKPFKSDLLTHCNNESFFYMFHFCLEPYLSAGKPGSAEHLETLLDYLEKAQCTNWKMKAICFRNYCKIYEYKLTPIQKDKVFKIIEGLFNQYSTEAEHIQPTPELPLASIISKFGYIKLTHNLSQTSLVKHIEYQKTFVSSTTSFSRIFDYIESSPKKSDWYVPYVEVSHFLKAQIKSFISTLKENIEINEKNQLLIDCEPLVIQLGQLVEIGKKQIQYIKNLKLEMNNYHTLKHILEFCVKDSQKLMHHFELILFNWNQNHPIPALKNHDNMQALISRQITLVYNQLQKDNTVWDLDLEEESFKRLYALLESIQHMSESRSPAMLTMQMYMKVFFTSFLLLNEKWHFSELQSSVNPQFKHFTYPELLQEVFDELKAGINTSNFSIDPGFYRMLERFVSVIRMYKEKKPGYDHITAIQLIVSCLPKKKNKTSTPAELEITEIINSIHMSIYLSFFGRMDNAFLEGNLKFVQNFMSTKKALFNQQKNVLNAQARLSYLSDLAGLFKMEYMWSLRENKPSLKDAIKLWNKYLPQLLGIMKEIDVLSEDKGKSYHTVLSICFSILAKIRSNYFEINKDDLLDIRDLKQISTILLKCYFPLDKSQKKNLIDSFSSLKNDMQKLQDFGLKNQKIMQQRAVANTLSVSERLLNYLGDVIQLMNQCCPSGKEVIPQTKAIDYSSIDLNRYQSEAKPQQALNQPTQSISNNTESTRALPLSTLESSFKTIHKSFIEKEPEEQVLSTEILDQILKQLFFIENQIEKFKGNLTAQWESLKVNVFCTTIRVLLAYNNEGKNTEISTYCKKIMDLFFKYYYKQINTKHSKQTSVFEFNLPVQRNIFMCFESVLKTSGKNHDSVLDFLHKLLDYSLSPFTQMVILELRSRYINLSTQEMTRFKSASKQCLSESSTSIYAKLLSCNLDARHIRLQNWSENTKFGPKKSDGLPVTSRIPVHPEYYLKAMETWETDYFLPLVQALSKTNPDDIRKDIDLALLLKALINSLVSRLEEETNTLLCLSEIPDFPAALIEAVSNKIKTIKKYASELLVIVTNTEFARDCFPLWRKRILNPGSDQKSASDDELKSCIATMNERCVQVYHEFHKEINCNNLDKIRPLTDVLAALRLALEAQQHKFHFSDDLASIDVKLLLLDSSIESALRHNEKANELWEKAERKFLDRIENTTFKNDRILQKLMLEFYAQKLQKGTVQDIKAVIPKISLMIEQSAIYGFKQIATEYMDTFLKIHRYDMPELYISFRNRTIKPDEKLKLDNVELLNRFHTQYLLTNYISADKGVRDIIRAGALNQYFSLWKVFHATWFLPAITKLQNHAWHSLHEFKMEFSYILYLVNSMITETSIFLQFIKDLLDISVPDFITVKDPLNYIDEHLQTLAGIISSGKAALKETDFADWIIVLEERVLEQRKICTGLSKLLVSKVEAAKAQQQKAAERAQASGSKLVAQHQQEQLARSQTSIIVADEDYDMFGNEPESDGEEALPEELIPVEPDSPELMNAQQLDRNITDALNQLNAKLQITYTTYKRRIGHEIPFYVRRADTLDNDLQTIFSLYDRVVRYYKELLTLNNEPVIENNVSIQPGVIFVQEYMQKAIATVNRKIDLLLKYSQECYEINRKSRENKIWGLGIEFFIAQLKYPGYHKQTHGRASGNPAPFQPLIDAETLSRLQNNPDDVDAATRALVIREGKKSFIALGVENRKAFAEKSIFHKEQELFQTLTPVFARIHDCYQNSRTVESGNIETPYHFSNRRIITQDDYKHVVNLTSYKPPVAPKSEELIPLVLHQTEFENFTYIINSVAETINPENINFISVRLMLALYYEVNYMYKKCLALEENDLLRERIDPLIDVLNRQIFQDHLTPVHEDYIACQQSDQEFFDTDSLPFLLAVAWNHDELNELQGKHDESRYPSARLHFFQDCQEINPDYVLAEAIRFIFETTGFNLVVTERAIRHYQKSLESSKDPLQIAKIRYAVLSLKLAVLKSGTRENTENYDALLKEFYDICVLVMPTIHEFHSGKFLLEISDNCFSELYSSCVDHADTRIMKNVIALYKGLIDTSMRYDLLMMDPAILHFSALEMKRALLLKYPLDADFSAQMLLAEYQALADFMRGQGNPDARLLARTVFVMREFSERGAITFFDNVSKEESCRNNQDKQLLSDTKDEGYRQQIRFFPWGNKKEGSRTTDDLPENRSLSVKQRKRSVSDCEIAVYQSKLC